MRKEWIITIISDTHGKHGQISNHLKGGDLIIHCGDFSSVGYKSELESFVSWFDTLPYTYKIFIAGNHELSFENRRNYINTSGKRQEYVDEIVANLPDRMFYLEHSSVVLDGIKFFGSPYTPEFNSWAFNIPHDKTHAVWKDIPDDTDVVISHGPMYGYVDTVVGRYDNLGDMGLHDRILQVKPAFHCCGHVHTGYGFCRVVHGGNRDVWTFNGSVLDERYVFTQPPLTIDFDFENRSFEFVK